jgi:hypothetical protein
VTIFGKIMEKCFEIKFYLGIYEIHREETSTEPSGTGGLRSQLDTRYEERCLPGCYAVWLL